MTVGARMEWLGFMDPIRLLDALPLGRYRISRSWVTLISTTTQ